MLRSLTSYIWGNANSTADLAAEGEGLPSDKIGNFLFQIVDFPFYKGTDADRSPIYVHSTLGIHCISKSDHKYSVWVFDPKYPDQKTTFPIHSGFALRVDSLNNIILSSNKSQDEVWFGETGKSVNKPTIDTFKLIIAQCIFETTTNKSHSEASDRQLDRILQEMSTFQQTPFNTSRTIPLGTEVYKSTGKCALYSFEKSKGVFIAYALDVTTVIHRLPSSSTFTIHIGNEQKGRIHSQYLEADVSEHVDKGTGSFVWCYWPQSLSGNDDNEEVSTFCLRWESSKDLIEFSNSFGQCLWEVKNGEAISKMKKEDLDFLLHSYNNPMDVDTYEVASENEKESETESDSSNSDDEYKNRSSCSFLSTKDSDSLHGINQHLVVGYKDNRSFVSRGSSIGVFKSTNEPDYDEGGLEFVTNIKNVQSVKGQLFTPDQVMLHNQDSSLLLTSSQVDKHKIFRMDLERGKVVDEWTIHPDTSVTSLIPAQKHAQMSGEQTLIGINPNSIFRIDPRLSGNKRVDSQMKSYVVKNEFSCGTTTTSGELAVASAKGEIRLYDKLDKRAKSLIPGFGDAILGIDVVEGGEYIVATCKSYLLLIPTELEGDTSGKTAFSKSSSAGRKPAIRLQLRPEHVAYMSNRVSFTPAHFSGGEGLSGRTIVTSTGPYIIIWNLDKIIKESKLYDYQIRKYSDNVIADNFRNFDQDDSIIVTLPHHVTVADKGSLVKPTAKTFK